MRTRQQGSLTVAAPERRSPASSRVLLANGDEFTRSYLERILASAPIASIDSVAAVDAALERLADGDYDLLLLDPEMPDRSGLELLAALRADPRTARLPVVITTSAAQADTVRAALQLGVADYILKPFVEEDVRQRIARALPRRRLAAESPRETIRILIADADADFLEAARQALHSDFDIATARTLPEWIAKAARLKPDCAIVDPAVFGRRLSFCLNTLERACRPATVKLIHSAPLGDDIDARPEWAGSIAKQLGAEELRAAVADIVNDSHPASFVRLVQDNLEAIIRQSFGMVTGAEAEPCEASAALPDGAVVSVRLLPATREPPLRLTLAAELETARALTAEMSGVEADEIQPAQAREGFLEAANLIGGGLKRCAADREIPLRVALPAFTETTEAAADAEQKWFRWGDGAPFVALLEENPERG